MRRICGVHAFAPVFLQLAPEFHHVTIMAQFSRIVKIFLKLMPELTCRKTGAKACTPQIRRIKKPYI